MAEIRVEPRRKSVAWFWGLLAILIVVGVTYYMFYYQG